MYRLWHCWETESHRLQALRLSLRQSPAEKQIVPRADWSANRLCETLHGGLALLGYIHNDLAAPFTPQLKVVSINLFSVAVHNVRITVRSWNKILYFIIFFIIIFKKFYPFNCHLGYCHLYVWDKYACCLLTHFPINLLCFWNPCKCISCFLNACNELKILKSSGMVWVFFVVVVVICRHCVSTCSQTSKKASLVPFTKVP